MSGRQTPPQLISPAVRQLLSPRSATTPNRGGSEAPQNGAATPTTRSPRPRRPARTPPPPPPGEATDEALAGSPRKDPAMTPIIASVMDPPGGHKAPEEEYKKVIMMLRAELGRARVELQQLREQGDSGTGPSASFASPGSNDQDLRTELDVATGRARELEAANVVLTNERASFLRRAQLLDKDCSALRAAIAQGQESGERVVLPEPALSSSLAEPGTQADTDAARLQLALSKMSQLIAEVNDLKEENWTMKLETQAKSNELCKEVSARAKAQQDLMTLESQLNKLDFQLQQQVQARSKELDDARRELQQQGQSRAAEVERVGLQYEAKLADTISTYEEKLAGRDADVIEMARARVEYQRSLGELESRLADTVSACNEKIAKKDAELIELARMPAEYERKIGERDKKLAAQDEMIGKLRQELENFRSAAGEELKRQASEMLAGNAFEKRELEDAVASMKIMLHNSQVEQEKHKTHGRTLATRLITLNEELELEKAARQESEKRQQLQTDREEALLADLESNAKKISAAERAHSATREALREAHDRAAKLENRVQTLEKEHIAAVQREMDTHNNLSESARLEARQNISMLEASQEQVRKLEHEVQTLRREMIRLNADLEDRDMKLEDERLARQRAEEKARLAGQDLTSQSRAIDAGAVEKLELELEQERQRRRRAEEDIKNLVDDMDELAGSSEAGVSKAALDAESVARQRAEAALETMLKEVEELKEGHAQKLQSVLQHLHGLQESSALKEADLLEQREKRRQAEEALESLLVEVEQLREGNTEQMKKVGAEIVKLQKSNQLKREASEQVLEAERQARKLAEEGMKEAWTIISDLKAQLGKQQGDLTAQLSRQTPVVFIGPDVEVRPHRAPAQRSAPPTPPSPQDESKTGKQSGAAVDREHMLSMLEQKMQSVSARLATPALQGDATAASPLPRAQPRGGGGAHTDAQTPRHVDNPAGLIRQDVIRNDAAGNHGMTRRAHSILSPRSPESSIDSIGGLGLGLGTIVRNDQWAGMKVTELIPDSPAAEVGVIKVGDELVAVDGESIKDYNFEEVIRKVQGPIGSKVSLYIARHEAEMSAPYKFHVTLVRVSTSTYSSADTRTVGDVESGMNTATAGLPPVVSRPASDDVSEWDA